MTNKNLPAETQFFAVETKGRNGVRDMVAKMADTMWATKPSYLVDSQRDAFFQKAIMNISNDEKLKPLTATRDGLFQIFLALSKGVQVGMVPGGMRPQFYIVPRKKYVQGQGWKGEYIATFVPTADGYRYIVTTGTTAIFRDVIWGVVRDGYDKFRLDEVNGIIEHEHDPIKTSENPIMGVWVKCNRINKDDVDIVKFVPARKIIDIRDNYSDAWKYAKTAEQKAGTVWAKSEEEQYIKTAVKSVLKHYISKSEGMAQIQKIEAEDAERAHDYNNQDIGDRMENRLSGALDNAPTIEPENKVIEAGEILDNKTTEKKTGKKPATTKEKTAAPKKKEQSGEPPKDTSGNLF